MIDPMKLAKQGYVIHSNVTQISGKNCRVNTNDEHHIILVNFENKRDFISFFIKGRITNVGVKASDIDKIEEVPCNFEKIRATFFRKKNRLDRIF